MNEKQGKGKEKKELSTVRMRSEHSHQGKNKELSSPIFTEGFSLS